MRSLDLSLTRAVWILNEVMSRRGSLFMDTVAFGGSKINIYRRLDGTSNTGALIHEIHR